MLPRPSTRRVLGGLIGLIALASAFTAGVVAGAGSAPDAPRVGVLDDAAAQIAGSALRPVDRDALDAAAIAGMLRAAGDEWGSWAGAGGPAGVGVWLRATGGGLEVVRVDGGSPAEFAGVRPGDLLRGVDGRTTSGLSAPVAAAALRGPAGSAVAVVLARGLAVRTLTLQRVEPVQARVAVAYEDAGVTRITVPAFSRGTGRQVREALRSRPSTGVVLDLRGNPGGLLDEAVEAASAFLDGGPVVSYLRRTGERVTLDAVGAGNAQVSLVVLVDGGTASAAEVVAGALQDRDRAVLVGSRTFGKGTVQEPRTLPDGSALELTVAQYRTPAGRSPEGTGLSPDIEVAAGVPATAAERRALEVLSGLVADTGSGRG